MPIISCPSCKSRFKVPIDTVGRTLPCPRCKEPFQAVALHAGQRRSHGSGPIVYAAICIGALLVVLLIYAVSGSEPPVTETAEASSSADRETRTESRPSELLTPPEMLEKRARNLLDALRTGDHPLLPGWIAYQRMHEVKVKAGVEETPWEQLAQEQEYAKREQYINELMGDEATRKFSRAATIESLDTTSIGSGHGKVHAVLRNALTDLTQELTLHFVASAGAWKVYQLERQPIGGTQKAEPVEEQTAAEKIQTRRRNPQGEVAEVALLADVPAGTTREIESALSVLSDVSTTTAATDARRKIVDAGKPAIPHLLNALVPLDLSDPEDLLVATRMTGCLTDLTGQGYPIVPGINAGSVVGEGATENEINRRKWFGWWRDNQRTFEGPPELEFDPEDEVPDQKKNGRRRPG